MNRRTLVVAALTLAAVVLVVLALLRPSRTTPPPAPAPTVSRAPLEQPSADPRITPASTPAVENEQRQAEQTAAAFVTEFTSYGWPDADHYDFARRAMPYMSAYMVDEYATMMAQASRPGIGSAEGDPEREAMQTNHERVVSKVTSSTYLSLGSGVSGEPVMTVVVDYVESMTKDGQPVAGSERTRKAKVNMVVEEEAGNAWKVLDMTAALD